MSAVKGEAPPATEAGGGGSFIFERASFMNNMLATRPSTDNNAAFWDFDGRAHVSDQPLPPPPGQDARPSNPDASAQSGATLDKESRWAHVRRLSAMFQKLVTEVPASGELSKETYYEMYNTAVSLVRAVDPLDPDRAVQAARSSEVFMPTGSFSLALGGMANGAATGSAPTTAGADLDWLSRRSMDLFPRASFSLPHEPPLLPVPAPPPAPSPASAATSTTMSAPPASTPQQQQQQQLTSHLQSQQHLQLPPPPHGQYQHPAQSLQSQPSSGQPMLSMPPYHPSLTPPARMAQQQPQPPQQLQQQTQQMQQPQQSQQQPMQQQSQPSQQQPQQPPTFFGVSGPFVMNPGPYVMQNYLPPFATRAQQGANAPGGYGYPPRFLPSQQMQMASQSAPPPASSFPTISLPPVIRTTSNQPEIIFTSGEEAKTKRRAGNVSKRNLRCNMCNATETPEWRRGPDGEHTLCNACGLHYAKVLKRDRANKTKRRKHSIESLLNKDTKKDIAAAVAAAAAAASGTSVPPAAAGAPAASTESKSVSCDDDSRKSND